MSYLCFEVKNYIGCLIHCFNFIFSTEYKIQASLYRHALLQNYLDVASKKLHQQFVHSTFWLSKERIYDVHNYFETIDQIELSYTKAV